MQIVLWSVDDFFVFFKRQSKYCLKKSSAIPINQLLCQQKITFHLEILTECLTSYFISSGENLLPIKI
jgi:hypothetical protein